MSHNLAGFFGLSGVHRKENRRAVTVGRLLEWPMILIAFWIILEWYIDVQSLSPMLLTVYSDWIIWLFFLAEMLALSYLVDDKYRFLKSNWGGLVIIVAGMPVLWNVFPFVGGFRILRLLVLFSLLFSMSNSAKKILSHNNLGTTLMVSFIVIVFAGTMMAAIDPNIQTPLDGVWWAWVTVTTVGYGDIVPTSSAGRMFAGFLILLGVALFSMLTASFSAFFLSETEGKISSQETANAQKLDRLQQQMISLESKLDLLIAREDRDHHNDGDPKS